MSKVPIYRYFGSYRDLIEEWALTRNFWITSSLEAEAALTEAAGNREAIAALLKRLVRAQAEELRSDRVSREILRWFLAERDTAAVSVMARLEERGTAIAYAVAEKLGGEADFGALSAIVISGVYYLALLADRATVFNGVDIATDSGWERIFTSLDILIDTLILSKV